MVIIGLTSKGPAVYLVIVACVSFCSPAKAVNSLTVQDSSTQQTATEALSCNMNGTSSITYTFDKTMKNYSVQSSSRYGVRWTTAEGTEGPFGGSNSSECYIFLDAKGSKLGRNSSASFSVPVLPDVSSVCVLVHYATTGKEKHSIFVYAMNTSSHGPTSSDEPAADFLDLSTEGVWRNASSSFCVAGETFLSFQSWSPKSNSTLAVGYIVIAASEEECFQTSSAPLPKTPKSSSLISSQTSSRVRHTSFEINSTGHTTGHNTVADFTTRHTRSSTGINSGYTENMGSENTDMGITFPDSPNSEPSLMSSNTGKIASKSTGNADLTPTHSVTSNTDITTIRYTHSRTISHESSFTGSSGSIDKTTQTANSANSEASNSVQTAAQTVFSSFSFSSSVAESTTSVGKPAYTVPAATNATTGETSKHTRSTAVFGTSTIESRSTASEKVMTSSTDELPWISNNSTTEQSTVPPIYTTELPTSSNGVQNFTSNASTSEQSTSTPVHVSELPTSFITGHVSASSESTRKVTSFSIPALYNSTDDPAREANAASGDNVTIVTIVLVSALAVAIITAAIVCFLKRRPSHKGMYITDDVVVATNVPVSDFTMHSLGSDS